MSLPTVSTTGQVFSGFCKQAKFNGQFLAIDKIKGGTSIINSVWINKKVLLS